MLCETASLGFSSSSFHKLFQGICCKPLGINSHYFGRIQLEGSQHETIDVRTKELFYQ